MRKLYFFIILFLILWLIPIGSLILNYFDVKDFFEILFKTRTLRILKYTFLQASLSVIISFLISFFPSLYVANNKNYLSKILENSFFIPFFFPPIPTIIAFSLLYSSNGLISKLFNINILYSLTAIILAHSFYNSPIIELLISLHSLTPFFLKLPIYLLA
ncbi:hypothetical protein AS160_06740 [Marinitoga sp. 38H-ov]|nr:hypothetical protein [Marinitoga sp. 38H-ov]KAF2956226.1 hypothetical protein AS160_06740 [Marinitoga sp. 38H-ov]